MLTDPGSTQAQKSLGTLMVSKISDRTACLASISHKKTALLTPRLDYIKDMPRLPSDGSNV